MSKILITRGPTNHEHTCTKTFGCQSSESNLAGDSSDRLALVLNLSKLGYKRVGGVGDDGTDDTSNVTRGKGDTELGTFRVGVLGFGEDVGVEQLDSLLEEVELGHSVGDLIT